MRAVSPAEIFGAAALVVAAARLSADSRGYTRGCGRQGRFYIFFHNASARTGAFDAR